MDCILFEDAVPLSALEEFLLLPEWQHPSSTSSSQPSLSSGSPDSSPLFNNSAPVFSHGSSTKEESFPSWPSSAFPSLKDEDMMITRAISAIFASTSSPTSCLPHQSLQRQAQANQCAGFRPYKLATLPAKFEAGQEFSGQKMIKNSIAYLRKIQSTRSIDTNEESRPRLQHMVSERKRREKLNGSFHQLKLLLPPSSKKDKASVLCNTRGYLKSLEAQIFDLERRNQTLKLHLQPVSSLDVRVTDTFEPAIGVRRVSIQITVRLEFDILEVVLLALEYLKEKRAISLVSVDANNTHLQKMHSLASASLKFDIVAMDWDEESFKKGMTNAVNNAMLSP